MSSKAPSKPKGPAATQSASKTRKGSSGGARRSRATAATSDGGTDNARQGAEQPGVPEGETVGPGAAAKRAKGAAKSAGAAASSRGAKSGRATKKTAATRRKAAAEPRKRKKAPTKVNGFAVGDHVVYPAHGVGRITEIDERTVADQTLQMFIVAFEKDKMTLLVPTDKIESAGMRRLSSRETMDAAIAALRGRARTRRVMWSRRAQEYEAKLNSGDPVAIAEVVRDLYRNVSQPDQSYSERQMYEAALDRLAREFAAVDKTDTEEAATKLEDVLRAA